MPNLHAHGRSAPHRLSTAARWTPTSRSGAWPSIERALRRRRTLKVREYLAAGLPVVIGYQDTDFLDGAPFILQVPNEPDGIRVLDGGDPHLRRRRGAVAACRGTSWRISMSPSRKALASASWSPPLVAESIRGPAARVGRHRDLELRRTCSLPAWRAWPMPRPCPAELVVVDNASADGSVDLVRAWAADHPDVATLIDERHQPRVRGRREPGHRCRRAAVRLPRQPGHPTSPRHPRGAVRRAGPGTG